MKSEAPFVVVLLAGAMQGTAWTRYVLETVHDVFVGHLVCGGISLGLGDVGEQALARPGEPASPAHAGCARSFCCAPRRGARGDSPSGLPPCGLSDRSTLPSGAGPGCSPWKSMWPSILD